MISIKFETGLFLFGKGTAGPKKEQRGAKNISTDQIWSSFANSKENNKSQIATTIIKITSFPFRRAFALPSLRRGKKVFLNFLPLQGRNLESKFSASIF